MSLAPYSGTTTPALVESAGPSPALTELASPGIDTADQEFHLGAPAGAGVERASAGARRLPECWGHRGASASFPENTCMSFIEACKAGADGIETDIHITKDDVLVMFHDPELSRTTDGRGRLHDQPWHGVLEHVRTLQTPHQPIPLFTQVLDILLAPGNERVKLNIDCKVENDPVKLFGLIKRAVEARDGWATRLAPRLVLGIWHPKFIAPATTILPYVPRYAITMSLPQARRYFFGAVHGFSVWYRQLATADGARFRAECAAARKPVCAWTVNDRHDMVECARWGVQSVISDKPELWRDVVREIQADTAEALKPSLAPLVQPLPQADYDRKTDEETAYLEREGGKFDDVVVPHVSLRIVRPADLVAV
ncbi:hypothetical protein Q5752_001998 [Cryptotrichosporon argae]